MATFGFHHALVFEENLMNIFLHAFPCVISSLFENGRYIEIYFSWDVVDHASGFPPIRIYGTPECFLLMISVYDII